MWSLVPFPVPESTSHTSAASTSYEIVPAPLPRGPYHRCRNDSPAVAPTRPPHSRSPGQTMSGGAFGGEAPQENPPRGKGGQRRKAEKRSRSGASRDAGGGGVRGSNLRVMGGEAPPDPPCSGWRA